jgi:hypothetical protein
MLLNSAVACGHLQTLKPHLLVLEKRANPDYTMLVLAHGLTDLRLHGYKDGVLRDVSNGEANVIYKLYDMKIMYDQPLHVCVRVSVHECACLLTLRACPTYA